MITGLVVTVTNPEIRRLVGLHDFPADDDPRQIVDSPSSQQITGPASAPKSAAPGSEQRASDLPESQDESSPTRSGIYIKGVDCVRRRDSVQVFADFLAIGDVDGVVTYHITNEWDAEDIYSESTPESQNFEVTGVRHDAPDKCWVDLQANHPTHLQSFEVMSN